MEITRTSMISGTTTTKEIDVTTQQIEAWEHGTLIQDAMPQLTPDEREFIKTGITAEEWQSLWDADDAYIKSKKQLPYL